MTAYIPALDLSDSVLLDELAHNPDMYVVEATGCAIARLPRRDLLPIATTVSQTQSSTGQGCGHAGDCSDQEAEVVKAEQ